MLSFTFMGLTHKASPGRVLMQDGVEPEADTSLFMHHTA